MPFIPPVSERKPINPANACSRIVTRYPRRALARSLLVLAFALHPAAYGLAEPLPLTKLTAGQATIRVEVAAEDAQRQKGLMFRTSMPADQGMLFVFDQAASHCMWMRNTLIPLDVAFLDERGTILNIASMQPLTENSHCAARPARFALEVNQGWFANHNLKPGAKISPMPAVKP